MTPQHAFVWVWLPGASEPVVAGRLDVVGDQLAFTYGRSYLARTSAISLFTPELPGAPCLPPTGTRSGASGTRPRTRGGSGSFYPAWPDALLPTVTPARCRC